jgi:hypothetical protein
LDLSKFALLAEALAIAFFILGACARISFLWNLAGLSILVGVLLGVLTLCQGMKNIGIAGMVRSIFAVALPVSFVFSFIVLIAQIIIALINNM